MECRARSTWFERELRVEPVWVREVESETGRKQWEIEELLEDLEREGKWTFEETKKEENGEKEMKGSKSPTPLKNVRGEKPPPSGHEVKKYEVDEPPTVEVAIPLASISTLTPTEEALLRPKVLTLAQIPETEEIEEPSPPPAPKSTTLTITKATPPDPQGQFTKLLSGLRIIERETPTDYAPAPPSLGPAAQEGISELAPLPVTTGKTFIHVPTGLATSASGDGKSAKIQSQANKALAPPIKNKEKARRQFMQKGSYITPAPGKAAEDVKSVSKEATAAYLAQEGNNAAAAQQSERTELGEDDEEETDSEIALEDLLFEQMEAARKEMEEGEDKW